MENKLEIINPDDEFYYDSQLWEVGIYPGAGAELKTFLVYAPFEQKALEIAVANAEQNAPGLLVSFNDVETLITENYQDEYKEWLVDNFGEIKSSFYFDDDNMFEFIENNLNYIYVDATEEGASEPYFVTGDNLVIRKVDKEELETKTESKELKQEVLDFSHQLKIGDKLYDGKYTLEITNIEIQNRETKMHVILTCKITGDGEERETTFMDNDILRLMNKAEIELLNENVSKIEESNESEEHVIWDSEFSIDDLDIEDLKATQYQDYLDNFNNKIIPMDYEEWLDSDDCASYFNDIWEELAKQDAYYSEWYEFITSGVSDEEKKDAYEDYVERCNNTVLKPKEFEAWLDDNSYNLAEEHWEIAEEDLEGNILPEIDKQLNDNLLIVYGYYGSNYPEFASSGEGGKLFEKGTDDLRKYMSNFDRVQITTENGQLGIRMGDHDGTASGLLYTIPENKLELLKAMGYEDRIKEDYAEEDLDKYNHNDLMETEFNNDIYYGGIEARDLTAHMDLLVPIKDTISGYAPRTPDPDGTKTESKEIITEDSNNEEFKLFVNELELDDVNASSLLFDSDTDIASYTKGDYSLLLTTKGDVRILDDKTGDVYKNYQQFPEDLRQLLRAGKYQNDTDRYTFDMTNWFELFLDGPDGEILSDVSDVEGLLNGENKKEQLEKYMKDMLNDYVSQLDENKSLKKESKNQMMVITDGSRSTELPYDEFDFGMLGGDYFYNGNETGAQIGFVWVEESKNYAQVSHLILNVYVGDENENDLHTLHKSLRNLTPEIEFKVTLSSDDYDTFLQWKSMCDAETFTFWNSLTESTQDEIYEIAKNTNIKEWYTTEYPDDELGANINDVTFYDLFVALDTHKNVYDVLGVGDSVVRERVFKKLDAILEEPAGYCYDQWLLTESKDSTDKLEESDTRRINAELMNNKDISKRALSWLDRHDDIGIIMSNDNVFWFETPATYKVPFTDKAHDMMVAEIKRLYPESEFLHTIKDTVRSILKGSSKNESAEDDDGDLVIVVEFWETEEDREEGLGSIYDYYTESQIEDAIAAGEKLVADMNYAAVEVYHEKEGLTYYLYDTDNGEQNFGVEGKVVGLDESKEIKTENASGKNETIENAIIPEIVDCILDGNSLTSKKTDYVETDKVITAEEFDAIYDVAVAEIKKSEDLNNRGIIYTNVAKNYFKIDSEHNHTHSEPGKCPVCGNEDLEYTDTLLEGNSYGYRWDCHSCETAGYEWYVMSFDEIVSNTDDATSKEEGQCPVCHSDVEYGSLVPDGMDAYYEVNCTECDFIGKEYYTLTFDGHEIISRKTESDEITLDYKQEFIKYCEGKVVNLGEMKVHDRTEEYRDLYKVYLQYDNLEISWMDEPIKNAKLILADDISSVCGIVDETGAIVTELGEDLSPHYVACEMNFSKIDKDLYEMMLDGWDGLYLNDNIKAHKDGANSIFTESVEQEPLTESKEKTVADMTDTFVKVMCDNIKMDLANMDTTEIASSEIDKYMDGYNHTKNAKDLIIAELEQNGYTVLTESKELSYECPQCGEKIEKLVSVDAQDLSPEELDSYGADSSLKECPECGYRTLILDFKKETLNESDESGTISFELHTDLVPILNMNQYNITGEFDVPSDELDKIMRDFAEPIIVDEITKVFPSANVTFGNFDHPKYYRAFSNLNDTLDFTVTVSAEEYEAKKQSVENTDEFAAFLKDNYKSYDGFVSYMADNLKDFQTQDDWKQFVSVLTYFLTPGERQDEFYEKFYEYICDNYDVLDEMDDDILEENNEQDNEVAESIEEQMWTAVCSDDRNFVKNAYNKNIIKPNTRYVGGSGTHSFIMGALRNGNFEMADLLKSFGERILKVEVEEYKDIMAKRTFEDETTRTAMEESYGPKSKWSEIRAEFFDEEENVYCVDAWTTADDEEEGAVIAKVNPDTKEVIYLDGDAKTDSYAQEIISELLEESKSIIAHNIKWDTDNEEDAKTLPSEIVIPADKVDTSDEEAISDYITNETGFCHKGFDIKEETKSLNEAVVRYAIFKDSNLVDGYGGQGYFSNESEALVMAKELDADTVEERTYASEQDAEAREIPIDTKEIWVSDRVKADREALAKEPKEEKLFGASDEVIADSKAKGLYTESKDSWLGINGAKYIWRGEWSDPQVSYKGYLYNYWDVLEYVGDSMGAEYEDKGLQAPDDIDAVHKYMEDNPGVVECALLDLTPDKLNRDVISKLENNYTFDGLIKDLEELKSWTDIPEEKIDECIKLANERKGGTDFEDAFDEEDRVNEFMDTVENILSEIPQI